MTQYARPDADIITGVGLAFWAPTPLYEQLNEIVASDSDYIYVNLDSADPGLFVGQFVVGLSTLTDPTVDTGHVLRFRARLVSGLILTQALILCDGAGSPVGPTFYTTMTSSFQTFTFSLTEEEAALLDGLYSDMSLSFGVIVAVGTASVEVSWAELEVPDVPVDPSPTDLAVGETPISWREIGTTWTDNSGEEDHFDIKRDGTKIDEVPADTESYTDDDTALQPDIDPDVVPPSPETFCYVITAIAGDGSEIGSTDEVCGTPAQVVYASQTIYCSPAASDYYEPLEEVDGLTYTEVGDEASPSYSGITGTTPSYTEVSGSTPPYTELTS